MIFKILLKIRRFTFHKLLSRIYLVFDYIRYAHRINKFKKLLNIESRSTNKALLIVSGRGMNVTWAQIWTVLSSSAFLKEYKVIVITYKKNYLLNLYYSLMPIKKIYFEDAEKIISNNFYINIVGIVENLKTFEDFKEFIYKDTPVGQIALSTFTRHYGTGVIELSNPDVSEYIKKWILIIVKYLYLCEYVYKNYNIKTLFMTEVFLEEYGAFYYSAINNKLNVIRFAGTVRDNAYILQHLSVENDRIHHSSISKHSFDIIKKIGWNDGFENELNQNFMDRYGDRWYRSKRNQPSTVLMSAEQIRNKYRIAKEKKVVIIYSHILYDTLFFFGTDLFSDYAEWLIESVKVACESRNVEWFIKVHPSNIWRGELNSMLKGKYEEERLIKEAMGELPDHVRIIPADNDGISPYSWFQFADYGVTVRGTSGLEMAALGKTVICAGTGRYEGNGFTVDPADKQEYLDILKNIHRLLELTAEQKILAKQYAHAIFLRKPFELDSLIPTLRMGVKSVVSSDDIVYLPNVCSSIYSDIEVLSKWIDERDKCDLLKGIDYNV